MQTLERLPKVRGRYRQNAPLAPTTWFQVGGCAEVMYKPADLDDLKFFLQEKPHDIPVHIIGVGSNLIVRDGGVPGVVIRLGKGFHQVYIENNKVTAGAGVLDKTLAYICRDHSLSGLEYLVGIPGSVGGAVFMNAGAYGDEVKDRLVCAQALDPQGNLHTLNNKSCGFSYRKSQIPTDWLIISATFEADFGDHDTIHSRHQDILTQREATQPTKGQTGGSTFKNPPGVSAWELIDKAGFRGYTLGGAQVSQKHCNFLMNTGSATAEDLETLGEQIRHTVKVQFQTDLEWEIQRIGRRPVTSKQKAA